MASLLGLVLFALPLVCGAQIRPGEIVVLQAPVVETEEDIYSYTPANNGAEPLWDIGSTNLVRVGNQVFASGFETLDGVPPDNNTQCTFWRRDADGWVMTQRDPSGQTREPCPLATLPDRGTVFMSSNPTLNPPGQAGGGPAKPVILAFPASEPEDKPVALYPTWWGAPVQPPPPFTQHSYRSFAADREGEELILFQNVGDTHVEWALRDREGYWAARNRLTWPWGAEYEQPKPVRICYPNVAIRNRAVHFVGVSDVVEPNQQWRKFKRELTGNDWDYDFRRLFYNWSPDISAGKFSGWIEIASRERTAGHIQPGDLWLAPDGAAHIVWTETALDARLREKFFPGERQRHELNYAIVREGKVVVRRTLLATDESRPGPIPYLPRFQVTPEQRLFVFFYVGGANESGKPLSENRLFEILGDGATGPMMRVPLERPLSRYMTATVRAGSAPSRTLDLLGTAPDRPGTIRYARIRLY